MADLKRVYPPNGLAPEVWLEAFDASPRLAPIYPPTPRLCLILVAVLSDQTIALLVENEAELDVLAGPGQPWGTTRLFFTVPKSLLSPAIVPDLYN